jgi:hypothetical protein
MIDYIYRKTALNYLSLEVNPNHESEVFPVDVKHSAFANSIGMRVPARN